MINTLLLALALLSGKSEATTDTQKSNLIISPCDMGDHMQFDNVDCDIPLRNIGDTPIRISEAESSAKADVLQSETVVPPQGTSYLKAHISLGDALGITKHSFRFKTSEAGVLSERGSSAYGFVSTVLDQGNPAMDLGTVNIEDLPVEKTIELSSREVPEFRVLAVESKPDYVDVVISSSGKSVNVRVGKAAPVGVLHEKVVLRINGKRQSRVSLALDLNVRGDVVPDSNPLVLGLIRAGEKNEILIRLTSRSGKEFEVAKVLLPKLKASSTVESCASPTRACKLVRLHVSKEQNQGAFVDTASIELAGGKQAVPVRIEGLLLAPDVKIHNLTEEARERQASGIASPASSAPEVDVSKAIKQSVADVNDAPLPGNGPLLRWAVLNQNDIYGFIIWRADSENGPSLRVNETLVKADPNGSGKYQWRDNSAKSGSTYWYSIGYVKNDGLKVDLSGRQKTLAK